MDLIKVGIVSSINAEQCTARVAFPDRSNTVSNELPIIVRGSLQNKDYWMPSPGEQVVCLFLPTGNAQGFIIGSVYSDEDKPPITDPNKRHLVFSDGTTLDYDVGSKTLTIHAVGAINIVADGGVQITGKDRSESW